MKNKFKVTYQTGEFYPEIGKFPGGEVRVKLTPEFYIGFQCKITAYLFNSDDIMALVMIVDALRVMGVNRIYLTMPYIPYARQDRVCNEGEAFSTRAFARIINSLDFASVVVWDAHSPVSTELINRCTSVHQAELIIKHNALVKWVIDGDRLDVGGNFYIVAPDKGSIEKAKMVSTILRAKGVIYAEKERDLATGKIIRTSVKDLPDDISNARLLVVDDICDFGTTFVEISKVLRPKCKELSLYVTHGIFSGGKDRMYEYFDNVWSTTDFEYNWNACLNKFTNS